MYWPSTKIAQGNIFKTWTCKNKYLAITSINLLHMNIKCMVNTSVLPTRIRHTSVKCKVFIVLHVKCDAYQKKQKTFRYILSNIVCSKIFDKNSGCSASPEAKSCNILRKSRSSLDNDCCMCVYISQCCVACSVSQT